MARNSLFFCRVFFASDEFIYCGLKPSGSCRFFLCINNPTYVLLLIGLRECVKEMGRHLASFQFFGKIIRGTETFFPMITNCSRGNKHAGRCGFQNFRFTQVLFYEPDRNPNVIKRNLPGTFIPKISNAVPTAIPIQRCRNLGGLFWVCYPKFRLGMQRW